MNIQDFTAKPVYEPDKPLIEKITNAYLNLAVTILASTAPSEYREEALRRLLESKMTLIHGITHT